MLVLVCMSPSTSMSWAEDGGSSAGQEPSDGTAAKPAIQSYAGELMIVSATIMGFGGFGGLLAARFRGNDISTQVACTLVIYAAILCKMVLHLHAILLLSSGAMSQQAYAATIGITMGLVAAIVACFCVIAVLKHDYDRDRSSADRLTDSNITDATGMVKRSPV